MEMLWSVDILLRPVVLFRNEGTMVSKVRLRPTKVESLQAGDSIDAY
jgi:hypothetical protein